MAVKRLQNTHEKAQPEWVQNSKLFHKRDASIPHSNLTKKKGNIKKLQNQTPQIQSSQIRETKSQIIILKMISVKIMKANSTNPKTKTK